jgi:hypothetical protein
MGLFSKITGMPDSEKVGNAAEKVGNALDKLFTSKDEKLSHAEVLERIKQAPQEWQAKITLAEASHRSVFVAGWRPFIGWVAGASLAMYFLPQYAMGSWLWFKLSNAAIAAGATSLPMYPVSAEGLLELVLGLLGLAAMRSAEKMAQVTK